VSTPFHLPVGVQLLHVYVESKEFYKLQQGSTAARSAFESVANRKLEQKKVRPIETTNILVKFEAFTANKCAEIFSGYQPHQC
jgi:hypothetical protein